MGRLAGDTTSDGVTPGVANLEKTDEPFRLYYNDACRKIVDLELRLRDAQRTSDEAMAVLVERVALFVYRHGVLLKDHDPRDIAGKIRMGSWHEVSADEARASLVGVARGPGLGRMARRVLRDAGHPHPRAPGRVVARE